MSAVSPLRFTVAVPLYDPAKLMILTLAAPCAIAAPVSRAPVTSRAVNAILDLFTVPPLWVSVSRVTTFSMKFR